MQHSVYQSPLGPFFLWFAQDHLVYASFNQEGGERFTAVRFPDNDFPLKPLPEAYARDLNAYFRGDRVEFNWPVRLLGTRFRSRCGKKSAGSPMDP